MTNQNARNVLAVNGKSFYWASFFLGNDKADDAAQLYKFCRFVDDLADGNDANKMQRLINVRHCLKDPSKSDSHELEVAAFLRLADRNKIPLIAACELLDGMLADQNPARFITTEQLLRYCHAVAGTVGLMMCRVLGCQTSRADSFAIDLGIAMQLTNIARDILEDSKMGRRYIPSNWLVLCESELSPSGWAEASPQMHTAIANGCKKLLDIAEIYYASAMLGIHLLPWRSRFSINIALRIYRHIGRQLKRNGCAWWRGRVVVSALQKTRLSMFGLSALLPRRVPPHASELHHSLRGLAGVIEH